MYPYICVSTYTKRELDASMIATRKMTKAARNITDLEKETVWKEARWEARSLCINVGLDIHRAITECYSVGSSGGRGWTE